MSYAQPSPPIEPDALLHQVVGERFEPAGFGDLHAGELLPQRHDALALRGDAGLARLIRVEKRRGQARRRSATRAAGRDAARWRDVRVERHPEAEPELRVVLEERVRPRRAAAVAIRRVRRRRQVAAVDRRAAGRVGDEQPVAEELREQLEVRRLAAARAGARVFEQRLEELRALVIELRHRRPIQLGEFEEEVVVRALRLAQRRLRVHVDRLVLRVGAILGRADVDAQVAARAVLRRDLDREVLALVLVALEQRRLERRRRARQRALVVDLRANRRVRADERALVALDADLRVPDRNLERDVALLPFRGRHRPRAVDGERADRQQVALAGQHDRGHLLHEIRRLLRHERRARARAR